MNKNEYNSNTESQGGILFGKITQSLDSLNNYNYVNMVKHDDDKNLRYVSPKR